MRGGGLSDYTYDLMLVISSYLTEIREKLAEYQVDQSKCVFTTDIHNWQCNSSTISKFMSILKESYINREFKVAIEKQKISSYGVAETYDGLSFIGNYADDIIGEMIDTGKVYSYDEIDAFLELSNRFYDVDAEGYFFDCGCNILSTAIYALNRSERLNAVAFEPANRTWRIAKANAALNNMDQRIEVINLALSDHSSVMQIMCNEYCCGSNYIVDTQNGSEEGLDRFEKVCTIALDDWIEENDFDINKISYLWIDVEGYEGYAVNGMMKLLRQKKVPMYLEYYADNLQRSGSQEVLLQCLEEIYSQYIVVRRGGIYDLAEVHAIKELRYVENMRENIFLIP